MQGSTTDGHDDPAPNSPRDVGHVHTPAPRRRRPPTDREFLEALPGGAYEGVEMTFDGFEVTLLLPNGRRRFMRRKTEAEALRAARAFVERQATR